MVLLFKLLKHGYRPLQYNCIEKIEDNAFSSMKNLKSMFVYNYYTAIKAAIKITWYNLNKNIVNILLEIVRNTITICNYSNLNDNRLTVIGDKTFAGTPNLANV